MPNVTVYNSGNTSITFLFYDFAISTEIDGISYNIQDKYLTVWQNSQMQFDHINWRIDSNGTKYFTVSNLQPNTDYYFEFLVAYSINGENYQEFYGGIVAGTAEITESPNYEVSISDNYVTISVNNLPNNTYINYYIYDQSKTTIEYYLENTVAIQNIFRILNNGIYYAKVTYDSGYGIPEIIPQKNSGQTWTEININSISPPTPQGDWTLNSQSISGIITQTTSVPYFNLSRHYLYRLEMEFANTVQVTFYSTGGANICAWLSSENQLLSWDDTNGQPNDYLIYNNQGGDGNNFRISYSCSANTTYYLWFKNYSGEAYNGDDVLIFISLSGGGSETQWHYDCDSTIHLITNNSGYSTTLSLRAGNGWVIPVSYNSNWGMGIFYAITPTGGTAIDTIAYLTESFSDYHYSPATGAVVSNYLLTSDDNSGENNHFELIYPVRPANEEKTYYLWVRCKNIQDSGSVQIIISPPISYTAAVVNGTNSIQFNVYNRKSDYYLKYFVRISSDITDVTYETAIYTTDTQCTVSNLTWGESYLVNVGISKQQSGGVDWIGAIGPLTISQGGRVYIYTNQGWKQAIPYIYTGSGSGQGWKQAIPYIYTENGWKQCGG